MYMHTNFFKVRPFSKLFTKDSKSSLFVCWDACSLSGALSVSKVSYNNQKNVMYKYIHVHTHISYM